MRFRDLNPEYIILLLVSVLLLTPGTSSAQDSHYWTYQYGTRAELLGGMVVGSIKDLSSTFYNPGAFAYSFDQGLLLTTDAFELTNFKVEVEDEISFDISNTRFNKAPGIFAMRFPFEVIGGNQLAISYITRQFFELELSDTHINSWWDPGWGTGNESYTSEFKFYEYLSDTWVGVTWAKPVSDRMALGATLYGSYRSQRMRMQTILQGAQLDGPGASATFIRDYDYWNVRTLLKLGATFDFRPLAFGAAVTLPSVSLFGEGSTYYDDAVVNIDIDEDGQPDSYLSSDYQDNLSSSYKSPASIAVGTSYGYRTTTLHFSVEYFGRMDVYEILQPVDFYSQTSGEPMSTNVTGGMKEVFNFGIGLDHKISERFSLYTGVTTDKTGYMSDVNTTITSWDLYHATLGSSFRAFGIDWTIGLGYSWGNDDLDLDLEFASDGGGNNVILPDGLSGRTDYTKFKLIIGFGLPTKVKEGTGGEREESI